MQENFYSNWQNVWYCARRIKNQMGWSFHIPSFLGITATALLPFVTALFPSVLIDLLSKEREALTIFATVLGFVLLIGILTLIAALARTYYERVRLRFRIIDMHNLIKKRFAQSFAYLETKQAGLDYQEAIQAHGRGSKEGIEKTLQAPMDMLGAIISVILYALVATTLHPFLVLVLFGCSAFQALFIYRNKVFEKKIVKDRREIARPREVLVAQCHNIQSAKDIRAYEAASWFSEKMQGYNNGLIALSYKWRKRKSLLSVLSRFMRLLRDGICYGYLIIQVAKGHLDIAAFTLYLSVFAGFAGYFETIVQTYWDISETNPLITAFRNYLEKKEERILPGTKTVPAGVHCFELQDVSFTYPESEEPVLHHVNLTIVAGEKLALVGLNGAGKTTLIKLLSGLYRPTEGSILMDGVDIQEYDQDAYYRAIGTVFQDDFSVAYPIVENVTCVPDGEEDAERFWRSLEVAGLAEKVKSYPNGAHTRLYQDVDPNGIALSGGELQRLILARALYKNAHTLILDEPTAALDPLAEAQMYERYNAMTEGKTSIFISHRLSSTQFCDRIVFLVNGRIEEQGTHEQLLAADGHYAELFRTQAQYYTEEMQ